MLFMLQVKLLLHGSAAWFISSPSDAGIALRLPSSSLRLGLKISPVFYCEHCIAKEKK